MDETAQSKPVEVLHIITGLGSGGAERQLVLLVTASNPAQMRHHVVSLIDEGMWGAKLRQAGAQVYTMGLKRGGVAPLAIFRLAKLIRRVNPDIVQTWLYHADLAGLLAAKLAGHRRLIWSVRCSDVQLERYAPMTGRVVRLLAMLSRQPAAVIANATEGRRAHQALGYRPRRWRVVHNGVDTIAFRPDVEARNAVRGELKLPQNALLVGNFSRHDPMKDHPTLLSAFLRSGEGAYLVLAGDGTGPENEKLSDEISASGVNPARVIRLGRRQDIPRLLAALDIAVLSSAFGEGLPNMVAEAMACGIVCAATDTGDTKLLLEGTEELVPPRDDKALGLAMGRLLGRGFESRDELGRRARAHVETRFSVQAMVDAHLDLYRDILERDAD